MITIAKRNGSTAGKSAWHSAQNSPAGAHPAGFTLIEVMLALVIFSIGLLAVASMQISSVTRNTSSRTNTMAVEYAADYLERLLSLGTGTDITFNGVDEDADGVTDDDDEILSYPQLAAGTHTVDDFAGVDWDNNGSDDIVPNPEFDDIFDLSWTVVDDDSASGIPAPATAGPVKVIRVTVSWGNGSKTISLNCIKSTVL